MQLEDLVRKAGALKRDDASSKNGGMNLPQGRDILGGGGVSDVSYRDYSYITRKNIASRFSQLTTATPTCEVLVREAMDLTAFFGCSLVCSGLNKS